MAETKKTAAPTAVKSGKSAIGLRVLAFVFWLLGIACEVVAVLILNKTIFVTPEKMTMWLIIPLVVDLVLVIIGSLLWKKSNRIDPASEKNKLKFWLWNNLGVIMSVIAFVPIIILFLANKDLDGKTKKIVTIVAAAALLISGASSYDWNPVSSEDVEHAKAVAEQYPNYTGTVYWTTFGKSYHYSEDCQTLRHSENVAKGTIDEAIGAKRSDPCDFCAEGAKAKLDALETDGKAE